MGEVNISRPFDISFSISLYIDVVTSNLKATLTPWLRIGGREDRRFFYPRDSGCI